MKAAFESRKGITGTSIIYAAAIMIMSTAACKKETTAPAANNGNNMPTVVDTVSTYSGRVQLAYLKSKNADPACFIDLASGKVYKVSEAKPHAAEIDMLWGTRTVTPDQKYFIGTSDTYILNAAGASNDLWKEADLYIGWSKRNATMMDNYNAVGFDDIKTRAQFNAYVSGKTGILTYLPFEGKADQITQSYYYDITHNGVKYTGVLKVTRADLADGWADFTIKLVKV